MTRREEREQKGNWSLYFGWSGEVLGWVYSGNVDLATLGISTAQAMLRKQPNEEAFGEGYTKNLYAGVNPTTNTSRASLSASKISHFWYFRQKKKTGRVTNRQSYKEQNLQSFQCQFYTKKKNPQKG